MNVIPCPDDAGVYEAPTCPDCGTPFAYWKGEGAQEQWRQACACLASSGQMIDGRLQRVASVQGARIGTSRYHWCMACSGTLEPGEPVVYGSYGVGGYIGYVHLRCAEQEQARKTQAAQERAAAQAVIVTVWFDQRDPFVAAPATGHNDGAYRMLPAALPDVPPSAVVYEDMRAPYAVSRIYFVSEGDADAWWAQATAIVNARYEIHWFDGVAAKNATRSWAGSEFRAVAARLQREER